MKVPPIMRQSFVQGVKTAVDPSTVPPDAIWDCLNMDADVSGVLRSRRGTAAYLASLGAGTVQGAIEAFNGILMAWNNTLYLLNDSGSQTSLGGTGFANGVTDLAEMIHWTRAGSEIAYLYAGKGIYQVDPVLGASLVTPYAPITGDKTNLIRKTDGTQDLTSGPAGCNIAYLRVSIGQRMAIAGNPKLRNTVYLSAPLDATYYPSDQILQLPDDGGKIVGIVNYYSTLLIFRDRDLWAFDGTDATDASARLYRITSAPGCVAGRTIVDVPNLGIVYLGSDNVYQLDHTWGVQDGIRANPIGDDIRKYLPGAMSQGTDRACAIYYDRTYHISIPTATQDQRVFRLNLLNGSSWWIDSGPRTAQFVAHKGTLHSASYMEGRIDKYTTDLMDNGLPIPSYTAFRRESVEPGPARIRKIFIYAMVKGRVARTATEFFGSSFGGMGFNKEIVETVMVNTGTEQDLDITLVLDGMEFMTDQFTVHVSKSNSLLYQNMEPVKVYEMRFQPHLQGHFVEIRINANKVGQDIAILGYGIDYSPRGRIHGERNGVQ